MTWNELQRIKLGARNVIQKIEPEEFFRKYYTICEKTKDKRFIINLMVKYQTNWIVDNYPELVI